MNDMVLGGTFAPLTDAEMLAATGAMPKARGRAQSDEPVEVSTRPDPRDPPLKAFKHRRLGVPDAVWFYRIPAGDIYGAVARHNTPDRPRRKEFVRWTYGK